MAREYLRWTDQFPTLTLAVSAPNTLAGQAWRVVVPLAGLTFDGRTDQAAFVGFVIAAHFGSASSAAAKVSCRILANAHLGDWAAGFDPRALALGSVAVELVFGADFAGMEDIPLVFYCAPVATDAPAIDGIALSVVTTNVTAITLKDNAGGVCGCYSEES